MNPILPTGFASHADGIVATAAGIEGRLTEREIRFLALLAAAPTCAGTVLEIGSFCGRSTVVLAKSAAFANAAGIVAVDPLSLPASTDPSALTATDVAASLRANLRTHGVEHLVEFHQMKSGELAQSWNRPLRLLWIDGDHTLEGARGDFRGYAPFLHPGAIVAFHDTLSRFAGPVRVLVEDVLASDDFGACGCVGSIAWAQYRPGETAVAEWHGQRTRLRALLAALIEQSDRGAASGVLDKWSYKIRRARIPHAAIEPRTWVSLVVRVE